MNLLKKQKVCVSIICNTYNHGKYIKNALDSFISQETNFNYEILIHDDASTDNTADIIREYEKKYPNLIKPIYQTENQYSKNMNITQTFQVPRVKGKYIALCEGDDYWLDSKKLQRQYDIMEQNMNIDMCAHAAEKIRASDGKILGYIAPCNEKKIFDVEEVIIGGGGFVATNSLFYRRELAEMPTEFRRFCPLDYALQIQGALKGGMLYLPEVMSAYRVDVPGSWSARMSHSSYADEQRNEIKKMLDIVDKETLGQYSEFVRRAKLIVDFASLETAGQYKELRRGKMREIYNEKTIVWKMKAYIKEFFPELIRFFRR